MSGFNEATAFRPWKSGDVATVEVPAERLQ